VNTPYCKQTGVHDTGNIKPRPQTQRIRPELFRLDQNSTKFENVDQTKSRFIP